MSDHEPLVPSDDDEPTIPMMATPVPSPPPAPAPVLVPAEAALDTPCRVAPAAAVAAAEGADEVMVLGMCDGVATTLDIAESRLLPAERALAALAALARRGAIELRRR